MRLFGFTGLTAIVVSAWRRNVQSWLTRTLPSGFRCAQPSELWLTESDPWPLPASARSRASDAACSRPEEKKGAFFETAAAALKPGALMSAALSSPLAALLIGLSLSEAVIGALTTSPVINAANASDARIRLFIALPH